MARSRQVVGLLTVLALILIVLGVTGVQVSLPGGGAAQPALPGVRARAVSTLLRAPQGGELAFVAVEPSGNLVVTDAKRGSVMRFDPTGHLLSEWGRSSGARGWSSRPASRSLATATTSWIAACRASFGSTTRASRSP